MYDRMRVSSDAKRTAVFWHGHVSASEFDKLLVVLQYSKRPSDFLVPDFRSDHTLLSDCL